MIPSPAASALRAPLTAEWLQQGLYSGKTLGQHVEEGFAAWPHLRLVFHSVDGPAFDCTLQQVERDSRRLASALAGIGMRAGEVIAVQVPASYEHLVLLIAATRLGLVFLPLLHVFREAELNFILGQSQARLLVVPTRWRNTAYENHVSALGPLPALRDVLWIGEAPSREALTWETLLARADGTLPARAGVAPGDPAILLYTSGTTSQPKGVLHTNQGIAAEVRAIARRFPNEQVPASLSCSVAGHVGAIMTLLRPFFLGNASVYLDRWDAPTAAMLIDRHQIVTSNGAPIFLNTLMQCMPAGGLPSFKFFTSGGASVPPRLIEEADRRGIIAARSYGSTEVPTLTSGVAGDPLHLRITTDGRLMPGCRVKLVDDAGAEVPPGAAGEIVCMAPELFAGYCDSSLDEAAFDAQGWFRTGDVGVIDAQGYLSVVDRKKDIIIRGGENISSREVEDIACRMQGVLESAAVPYPDPTYGERVALFIRTDGSSIDLGELQQHFVAERVARQKTPEKLIVVKDFPRNPSGKILKTELRRQVS